MRSYVGLFHALCMSSQCQIDLKFDAQMPFRATRQPVDVSRGFVDAVVDSSWNYNDPVVVNAGRRGTKRKADAVQEEEKEKEEKVTVELKEAKEEVKESVSGGRRVTIEHWWARWFIFLGFRDSYEIIWPDTLINKSNILYIQVSSRCSRLMYPKPHTLYNLKCNFNMLCIIITNIICHMF